MKKNVFLPILSLLFLMGCQRAEETKDVTTPEPTEEENAAEPIVLAENLKIPWSIEKDNDTFYLTEREGAIVKIDKEGAERQAVALEQDLSQEAEAGLLGFVLAPDFSDDPQAFAYYTYEGEEGPENRIVRLEISDNTWTETDVLLDNIPSGSVHHGGRLAIGPDEKLYATTGDASVPDLAQDLQSLAGKILRLNLDGTIPADNPFENSLIYSYGHRNPQGLIWLDDGAMFASEHGNQANDEINQIEPGRNYGWPVIEGTMEAEGMEAPIYTSGPDTTWAPSGIGQNEEKIYVAALRGQALLEMDVATDEIRAILTDYGRIRDVYIEEEKLYFVTNNTDGRGDPLETDDRLIQLNLANVE